MMTTGPLNIFTLIKIFFKVLAFKNLLNALYVCPESNAFLSTPKLD